MFWGECVAVSHRTGVDVYCNLQSQILAYVLEYMIQIVFGLFHVCSAQLRKKALP